MHDRDVRVAAWALLRAQHSTMRDVLMLDEFGIHHGRARVDIVVVNGELCGYELKSESDTLTRLPSQVAAYNAVLDRAVLICAASHLSKARNLVPRWWGLWSAAFDDERVELKIVREGRANPSLQPLAIAELLWRDEALSLLEQHGGARGLRTKPRALVYEAVAQRMTLAELRDAVRAKLKARTSWRQTGAAAELAAQPA